MLNVNIAISVAADERPAQLEQAILDALAGGVQSGARTEQGLPVLRGKDTQHWTAKDEPTDPETAYFPQDGGARPEPAQAEEKPAAKAPAKRTRAKAAAPKAAAEDFAEPAEAAAPAQLAEEPKDDQADADTETPAVLEDAPAQDGDAPSLEDAVSKATELVSKGQAAKVKKALGTVGAKRVSELSGDQVQGFLTALEG